MREKNLYNTVLGQPSKVELCTDFYKKQVRARSKTYEWNETAEHSWYSVTVRYRKHNSNGFDDYEELPDDNGIVTNVTYKNEKGIVQSVSLYD